MNILAIFPVDHFLFLWGVFSFVGLGMFFAYVFTLIIGSKNATLSYLLKLLFR